MGEAQNRKKAKREEHISLLRATFAGSAGLISLGLIAATLFIYLPVAHHDFLNWDDHLIVADNPYIADGVTWQALRWSMTAAYFGDWHPTTWISHMLDIQLFGLNPGPHHLTNLFLHILNTLLLFGILHQATHALGRSAFVAGLFAVHPMHVESVAWLAARTDVLSTLFLLLTIHGYFSYVRRPSTGRYVFVVIPFVLGLAAKPMLVTLPFVLLLLDFWPLGRVTSDRIKFLFLEKVPLFVFAIACSVITFLERQRDGNIIAFSALPLTFRIQNVFVAYGTYLQKMLWPTHLAVVYPYPRSIALWKVALSLLVLAGMTVVVIRLARRAPYLPVGWLWFAGTLVPVIGIVQIGEQMMADRYSYAPFIGLFIAIAWGIPDVCGRLRYPPMALPIAGAAVLAACVIAARVQTGYWRDNLTLWTHVLSVTSDNYQAHNNLGTEMADHGKVNEAIPHYLEAIRINPNFAATHDNLANALASQGKTAEAIEHYRKALQIQPTYANAHNGLGSALDDQGKLSESAAEYKEALRLKPGLAGTHSNLGGVLFKLGRIDEALAEFLEAARLDPTTAEYHYYAAMMLKEKGRIQEAKNQSELALRLNPNHSGARTLQNELSHLN